MYRFIFNQSTLLISSEIIICFILAVIVLFVIFLILPH